MALAAKEGIVMIDWVTQATKEIWVIAWRQHGIAPHESVIASIIAKHCPMKPDTAYMEVPRCATCSHFAQNEKEKINGYGACLLSGWGSQFHCGGTDGCVAVLPDFGCVQWAAKH
jgi:hypothetical protein